MRNLLILAPLFLAACGADVETACLNYIDAGNACIEEYADANGVDVSTLLLPDSTCDSYEGVTDQESADLLNCYADAYNAADCSTEEGFSQAGTDVSACL